jgi:hypothetical protein
MRDLIPPLIEVSGLSEQERESADTIERQLAAIALYVDEFEAAVQLFDRCVAETPPPPPSPAILTLEEARTRTEQLRLLKGLLHRLSRWKLIAARDGAVTLHNFLLAVRIIKARLDDAPVLKARLGASFDTMLQDFLRANFQAAKAVRDSVGHMSEILKSPKNALRSGRRSSFGSLPAGNFWMGNLEGRTFTTSTFDGVEASYEITDSTLEKYRNFATQLFVAVEQV